MPLSMSKMIIWYPNHILFNELWFCPTSLVYFIYLVKVKKKVNQMLKKMLLTTTNLQIKVNEFYFQHLYLKNKWATSAFSIQTVRSARNISSLSTTITLTSKRLQPYQRSSEIFWNYVVSLLWNFILQYQHPIPVCLRSVCQTHGEMSSNVFFIMAC